MTAKKLFWFWRGYDIAALAAIYAMCHRDLKETLVAFQIYIIGNYVIAPYLSARLTDFLLSYRFQRGWRIFWFYVDWLADFGAYTHRMTLRVKKRVNGELREWTETFTLHGWWYGGWF